MHLFSLSRGHFISASSVKMILSLLTCGLICVSTEAATVPYSTPDPAEFGPISSEDSLEVRRDSPIDFSDPFSREEAESVDHSDDAARHTAPSMAEIRNALRRAIESGRIDPEYVVTNTSDLLPLLREGATAPLPELNATEPVLRASISVRSLAAGESLGTQPLRELRGCPFISEEARTYLRPLNGPVDAVFVSHDYSEEYLMSLGEDTARMLQRQLGEDMDMRGSTPLLEHDAEMIVGVDERAVKLELGHFLLRTDDTVVFEAKGFPGVVVKYQTDCHALEEGDLIHPLVRAAWYMEKLSRLNLAPVVYFVSPPTWLNYPITPKTRFEMSRQRRAELTGKCTVRYVVMDSAGESLSSYMRGIAEKKGAFLSLPSAMWILKQVLQGLRRMHESGIVHGDIHAGTIALHDDGNETLSVKFTGFENAFFASQTAGTPEAVAKPFEVAHALYSHWELLGYRKAFRDDVFNALWMAAYMMNGQGLDEHAESLEAARALMAFKRDAFWFEVPGQRSVFAATLTADVHEKVKRGLDHMLSLVRGMDDVDAMPPYDELLAQLALIIDLVNT